jgi:hypothetical protein
MTDQIDRTVLPIRRPPFAGVAGKTLVTDRDYDLVCIIPPTNLQEHHLEEARKFADGLANRLPASTSEPR